MTNGLPQDDGGAAAVAAVADVPSLANLVEAINAINVSLTSRLDVLSSEVHNMHSGFVVRECYFKCTGNCRD